MNASSIIEEINGVCHSDELEAVARRICRMQITEGHLEIAQALEDARKRIPYTEILPNGMFHRALDCIGKQFEAAQ